jgi:acyl-CoA synthetase (AMP-forming)/AMP-acid ligase II
MVGYLNAPQPFDAEGWFNTEDRVEVDGDYLRILGRVSDIIIVGGQKVYPAEVEEVIVGLDGVVDATVYGEANNLLGRVVAARVELKSPEPPDALRARVRAACAKQLAAYKVPVKVLIATEPLHSARMKKTRATHG